MVPQCFNADQKRDRVLASQTILDRFWLDPMELFNRLTITDEIWMHIYV
jgi:hypothetical protein